MSFADDVWESIPVECRARIERDDVRLAVNHALLFKGVKLFRSDFVEGIAREIKEKAGRDVGDSSWNPDAHVQLTLTAKECRTILDAVEKLPLECVRCRHAIGPMADVDGEHAGWMCPKCMRELGGINES